MKNKINLKTMSNEGPSTSKGLIGNIIGGKMKRTLILAALMIVTSVSVLGQISDQKSDKDEKAKNEVVALVNKYNEMFVKRDVDALELILAEDYVGVSTNGFPISKFLLTRVFKEMPADLQRLEAIDSYNLSLRVYDNTAVLITKVTLKWAGSKEELDKRRQSFMGLLENYILTLVAVRQNGSWQVVSTHEGDASFWKVRESKP